MKWKISKNSFLIWLILSVIMAIFIYYTDYFNDLVFYPMEFRDLLLGSLIYFTIPYTIASFSKLVLELKEITAQKFWLSILFSLLCNWILFTIMLRSMDALDDFNFSEVPVFIKVIIILFLVLLCLIPFLFAPLLVPKKKVLYGPWWKVLLAIAIMYVIIILFSLITGESPESFVGELAEKLGGHYYIWLNLIREFILVMIVFTAGIQLGKSWANKIIKLKWVEYRK